MSAEDFTKVFSEKDRLPGTGISGTDISKPDIPTENRIASLPRPLEIVGEQEAKVLESKVIRGNSQEEIRALDEAASNLRRAKLVTGQEILSRPKLKRILEENKTNQRFLRAGRRYYNMERNIEAQSKTRTGLISMMGNLLKRRTPSEAEIEHFRMTVGYKIRPPEPTDRYIGGEPSTERKGISTVRIALVASIMICAGVIISRQNESYAEKTATFQKQVQQGTVDLGILRGVTTLNPLGLNPNSAYNSETKANNNQATMNWIRTTRGPNITINDGIEAVDSKVDKYFQGIKEENSVEFMDTWILVSSQNPDTQKTLSLLKSGTIPTESEFISMFFTEFSDAMQVETNKYPQNSKIIESQYIEMIRKIVNDHPDSFPNQVSFAATIIQLGKDPSTNKYSVQTGKVSLPNKEEYDKTLSNTVNQIQGMSDEQILTRLNQKPY